MKLKKISVKDLYECSDIGGYNTISMAHQALRNTDLLMERHNELVDAINSLIDRMETPPNA